MSSSSSAAKECPICLETLVENNNFIVTACGHEFHSDCFLTNVSHNGFDCPLCRNELMSYDNEEGDEEDDDDMSIESFNSDEIETTRIHITENNISDAQPTMHISVTDSLLDDLKNDLLKEGVGLDTLLKACICNYEMNTYQNFTTTNTEIVEIIYNKLDNLYIKRQNPLSGSQPSVSDLTNDVETIIQSRVF